MKRVLVIDDDEMYRKMVVSNLKQAGFSVLEASDGAKAIELAQTNHSDLIICDVMMDKLDGFGVLERLHMDPSTCTIPFIFMTGLSDKESMRKGMTCGADDFLVKPFTATELMSAVEARLIKHQEMGDEAERKLKDAFAALSADALKDSRNQFLSQADERLKPIQALLKTYEEHLTKIETVRSDAYGGLKNHLDTLARAHDLLQREAHQLSTALRSPTVRGRWGEMTLRRVVEVAGMSPHCDFEEQASVTTEDGRLRPDMVIRLPGNRTIVVDSKVPLAAYMNAAEAKDDAARQAALAGHAQDVRKHVRALGQKAYWDQFPTAPDFVILFLPG